MPKGIYPRLSAIKRLLQKVRITPSGCWEWQGKIKPNGYGMFWNDTGHLVYVHRFSYEYYIGSIPEGLQIDHLCRVRHCANPKHLEAVTARENQLRGMTLAATNAAKTHCIHGHPFDKKNTYRTKKGGRSCRRCGAEIAQRTRSTKRLVNEKGQRS